MLTILFNQELQGSVVIEVQAASEDNAVSTVQNPAVAGGGSFYDGQWIDPYFYYKVRYPLEQPKEREPEVVRIAATVSSVQTTAWDHAEATEELSVRGKSKQRKARSNIAAGSGIAAVSSGVQPAQPSFADAELVDVELEQITAILMAA